MEDKNVKQPPQADPKKIAKVTEKNYKVKQNIKYKGTRYSIGQSVGLNDEMAKEFKEKGYVE